MDTNFDDMLVPAWQHIPSPSYGSSDMENADEEQQAAREQADADMFETRRIQQQEHDAEMEADRQEWLKEQADRAAAVALRESADQSSRQTRIMDPQPRDPTLSGAADSVRPLVQVPLPMFTADQLAALLGGKTVSWSLDDGSQQRTMQLYTDDGNSFTTPDLDTGVDPVELALRLVPDRFLVDAAPRVAFRDPSMVTMIPPAMETHVHVWVAARNDKNSRVWRSLYARLARALIDARRPVVLSLVAPSWRAQCMALLMQHGLRTPGWAFWGTHLAGPNSLSLALDTLTTPVTVAAHTFRPRDGATIDIRIFGPGGGTWVWQDNGRPPTLVYTHIANEPEPEHTPPSAIVCHLSPGGDRLTLVRVGSMVRDMLGAESLRRLQCYTRYGPDANDVVQQLFFSGDGWLFPGQQEYFYDTDISIDPIPVDPRRVVTIRYRFVAHVKRSHTSQNATFHPLLIADRDRDHHRRNTMDVGATALRGAGMVAHLFSSPELHTYLQIRSDGATNSATNILFPSARSVPAEAYPREDGDDFVSDRAWLTRVPAVPTLLDDEQPDDQVLTHFSSLAPAGHRQTRPTHPNSALRGDTEFYKATTTTSSTVHFGVRVAGLHPSPQVARAIVKIGLVVHDPNNVLLSNGVDMVRVVVYVDTEITDEWDKTGTTLSHSRPLTSTFGLHRSESTTTFALAYNADVANNDVTLDDLLHHVQVEDTDALQTSSIAMPLDDDNTL